MIPAHVDTVIDKKPRLELRTQGDKWEGLGVYDMGAAVLNGIALAVETKVPDGMEVHFVFTPDEEMHSRGARQLMQKWVRWPEIDCVLSSEIGPIPPLKSGDKHMRLITGRSGRQKFSATSPSIRSTRVMARKKVFPMPPMRSSNCSPLCEAHSSRATGIRGK
jgi:acetylornithine deacetylase/succinyl-diaminopimelate desuccinylase-like protein